MSHGCGCEGHDPRDGREGVRPRIARALEARAARTVAEVSADPRALAALQRLGINHCCGAHLTLAEAAAAAGRPLAELLRALDEAGVAGTRPVALAGLDEAALVRVDVREDLRQGREPFARIMAAVRGAGPGQVVVLRAPFEPVPLYDVLGRRGLAHWSERHADDDWSVWFYRAGPAAAAPAAAVAAPAPAPPSTVTLDVRGLEPPLPMVAVLERLDTLAAGEVLEVIHDRRPMFLYPQLDDRGFAHETDEPAPGTVRIRIRPPAPAP
jgi:uncharacterized protein (DUF2249 family)